MIILDDDPTLTIASAATGLRYADVVARSQRDTDEALNELSAIEKLLPSAGDSSAMLKAILTPARALAAEANVQRDRYAKKLAEAMPRFEAKASGWGSKDAQIKDSIDAFQKSFYEALPSALTRNPRSADDKPLTNGQRVGQYGKQLATALSTAKDAVEARIDLSCTPLMDLTNAGPEQLQRIRTMERAVADRDPADLRVQYAAILKSGKVDGAMAFEIAAEAYAARRLNDLVHLVRGPLTSPASGTTAEQRELTALLDDIYDARRSRIDPTLTATVACLDRLQAVAEVLAGQTVTGFRRKQNDTFPIPKSWVLKAYRPFTVNKMSDAELREARKAGKYTW